MLNTATVIIPCRNEDKFIGRCLDTILAQDYPKNEMEIFVVDGMSTDKTRGIVAGYCRKHPFIELLDNPDKFTPNAFNAGIKKAKGEYIIIMGAHAAYRKDYISKCIEHAIVSGADNVGGSLVAKCLAKSAVAGSIALSLSDPFGAGGAFRLKIDAPMEVDTVFGGCYKKDVFERIGMFDERLSRSQDMELNMRLKKAGGKIMLFPDIIVSYYPKLNFKDFFVHNFWDGVWAIYPLKFVKMPLKLRHYVPLLFVLLFAVLAIGSLFWHPAIILLAGYMILYFAASLFFSAKIAIKETNWRYFFLVPAAFAVRHFGYGMGSLWGIIKLALPLKNGRKS